MALGVEHAQAVRHVVERGVETRRQQGHVARGDHRIEQRAAQPLGDEFHADERGDEQTGENPVVMIAVEQQRRGHRRPGAEDLHHHEAGAAEVAPEDAGRVGDCHREAHQDGKRIGGEREGEEAPHAQQCERCGRTRDVAVLPASGRFRAHDFRAHPAVGAHQHAARAGDEEDRKRAAEQERLAGLPIGDEDGSGDEEGPGQQRSPVLEQ